MNLNEVKQNAKNKLGKCFSCDICDGRACKNTIPGPGSKGSGKGATKNYEAWKDIEIVMDTIVEKGQIDTSFEMFGKKFALPVFAGPIANVNDHYSDAYTEQEYYEILVNGCKEAGICAWTGDGVNDGYMKMALDIIKSCDGIGIPTIKPWAHDKMLEKIKMAESSGAFAIASDVDSIGLPFLQTEDGMVNSLSVAELSAIIKDVKTPFIIKGIMNVNGAKKAIEAGAKAIVVSNHGGRVLDETPSTASVLKEIADYTKGKCLVLVDGGIRTGRDIFKALALGADAVLIARPFLQVAYGNEKEGILTYVEELKKELRDAMLMCGARKLSDISFDMVRINNKL